MFLLVKNKLSIKEYFHVEGDVSFVNANIDGDVKCFIDPSFLPYMNVAGFNSIVASQKIRGFFRRVLTLYKDGKKGEALKLFTSFQENNAFGLGYAFSTKKGRGLSEKMVMEFFDNLYNLAKLNANILSNPAIYQLFIRDFDKDRFTDLLTTIIGKELMDYSFFEAVEMGLPLSSSPMVLGKYWDGQQFKVLEGRCLMAYGSPIILVPFKLLTKKYAYTIERFLSNIIYPAKKAKYAEEHDGQEIKVAELKALAKKEFPERGYQKQYGVHEVIDNPNYLIQYLRFIETKGALAHSVPLLSCDDVA